MPDQGGYPTKSELKSIFEFANKLERLEKHLPEFIEELESIWWQPDWGFKLDGESLELHTGGWSGNEDIIEKLEGSVFWLLYWQKSERGGHYYFKMLSLKGK